MSKTKPIITATQVNRTEHETPFGNYTSCEISLGKMEKGARFTKMGDYDISLNEETESFELTRFVLLEKIESARKISERWHNHFANLIAYFKKSDFKESDFIISLNKTRSNCPNDNFKIPIQKVIPTHYE